MEAIKALTEGADLTKLLPDLCLRKFACLWRD